ncbi:MAG: glycosyltransferase [Oscillospiraceae bacterium]|nr:glycosyltransferase [Oscillospiraceae bacterium]
MSKFRYSYDIVVITDNNKLSCPLVDSHQLIKVEATGNRIADFNTGAVKGNSEYVVFLEKGAEISDESLPAIDEYIRRAADNVAAFEMHCWPVATGRHFDPVTLETTALTAGAVVIKREALEKVGGFDQRMDVLAYIDLSWRLRAAGYKLQYCPKASVYWEKTVDEKHRYIREAYERLFLGIKWKHYPQMQQEYMRKLKNPRHFPGVRKEMRALYMTHFLEKRNFRPVKTDDYSIADFSEHFGPWRGEVAVKRPVHHYKVSVIVRTHNRPQVLKRTLECLRNQIYSYLEIIVVEDGQPTAQQMIEENFADLPIKYYPTYDHVGRGRAGNIGIEKATGDMVCFLDDDDYFYPDFVNTFLHWFDKHPEADLVISGGMAYKTNIISTDPYEFTVEETYPILFDHITLMDMCVKCRIPMPCAMFRREMYEKRGGMREDIGGDEDWAMWLKFMAKGSRINRYTPDISRAMSLFGYPADEAAAKKREKEYRVYDRIMLYDENMVFTVHGSEISKWEEYVQADIGHLKNIGALKQFMADLKPLGEAELTYNPDGENTVTAGQINSYYYYLVKKYANN